jgi:CTP:molybdopterin cytidylyltransferase MocA
MPAAIVLAAGAGDRFHGPAHKLLTPFRGRPLVTWAVEHALAAELAATAVVIGAVDLVGLLPKGVEVITNPDWARGQATSLQAGLAWARDAGHQAVVVGLGDQPLVAPSAWAALAAAEGPIVVATYNGRRGNPVRLDHSIWDLLPVTGDAGARVLMAERPNLVVEVACTGDPADVDTEEDLARWS